MISSIMVGVDLVPQGGNDPNERDENRRANHASAEDNGGDDGAEEGVGQFDGFAEED